MIKCYKYVCFLRDPESGDCRHFKVELDVDMTQDESGKWFGGYIDFRTLVERLHKQANIPSGYTLIGMNCVDVVVLD